MYKMFDKSFTVKYTHISSSFPHSQEIIQAYYHYVENDEV